MEEKTLLFVDCIMRPEPESRTARLCHAYLSEFKKMHPDYRIVHRKLVEEQLMANKFHDVEQRETDESLRTYAKEFANADQILIGAPYWDLFFPALLKIYLEKVCIVGETFTYTPEGVKPLCKAKKMTYLMSCGGYLEGNGFAADYLKGLCDQLFGIKDFETVNAQGLDIEGMDVDAIMEEAVSKAIKLV